MKITRQTLRKLINEVYKDYESQKHGERARLNIPGLVPKLSSLEASGDYADTMQANQLALAMGSREPELPANMPEINVEYEMLKNKARAYLQSTLDYCEWVNSSEERFKTLFAVSKPIFLSSVITHSSISSENSDKATSSSSKPSSSLKTSISLSTNLLANFIF